MADAAFAVMLTFMVVQASSRRDTGGINSHGPRPGHHMTKDSIPMNVSIRNALFALTTLGLLSLAACKTTENSTEQPAPAASQPASDSGSMPTDDSSSMPPATDSSTPPADSSSDQQDQTPPTP